MVYLPIELHDIQDMLFNFKYIDSIAEIGGTPFQVTQPLVIGLKIALHEENLYILRTALN
jgi:hypothetical protein